MLRALLRNDPPGADAASSVPPDSSHASPAPSGTGDGHSARDAETPTARLRRVIDCHYDSLWRTLRYLGVPDASVDDAAQQALCVLARRLGEVAPGAEMAFLFATALRVASETRRAARRNRAQPVQDIEAFLAPAPSPEELVDEHRAHEVLEEVLRAIPIDLRLVFVLFEIEELGLAEIAELLGIPTGTVASRLRRARESFQSIVRRRQSARASAERGGRR
jgi:RNA polymerase sigma-70 factor (ECF subfamily)